MSNRKAVTVRVVRGGFDLTTDKTYLVEPCGKMFRDDAGDRRAVCNRERYRIGYEFRPGDRAHYFGRPGSTGTVIEHNRPTNVYIRWDCADLPHGVYPENLVLIKEGNNVTAPTKRLNDETQFNYVIFDDDRVDCVKHRPYAVNGNIQKLIDDEGDRQDVFPYQAGVVGCAPIEFIIRTIDAPNKDCIGKYVSGVPEYESGYIAYNAEHKAAAKRFTFEEVVAFLQFTRRKFEEGTSSEFEILLAPVRVGSGVNPEKRSNSGRRVGDKLRCVLSGRAELIVGQTYVIDSIDSDGDEYIKPVRPEAHTSDQLCGFPSLASNPEFARGSQFVEAL